MEKKLMKMMEEEKEKVTELIGVLKDKREAIEKNDTVSLKSILEKEKKTVDALNKMESERLDVTKQIAKEYNVEPTISELLAHIGEPLRHDLTLMAARLTELLNEVSLLNLGIQQMIAYRLEEFDVLMDAIRGKRITYDKYEKGKSGTVFNRRA
ncbi:flagellar protein FlgN [Mesoaciditoga sp.]